MRIHEIVGPRSHPYMASIEIEPSEIASVEQEIDRDPGAIIVSVDDRHYGQWVVHVGCSSKAKAAAMARWLQDT